MKFNEGGSVETHPKLLSEILKSKLTSVSIELIPDSAREAKGLELFKMDITNRKKWESPKELEKLCDIFGESVLQAFGPRNENVSFDMQNPANRDEAKENIKEGDFGDSDTIYVIAENGKPIGFLTGKNVEVLGGQKGFFLNLVFVIFEKRKMNISDQLYEQMFMHGDYEAIIGCTSTPQVPGKMGEVGEKHGYDTFFCGFKNGNPNDRGSAEEQVTVKKLYEQVQQEYVDCESTIPKAQMPDVGVVILKELEPMPFLTEKDIKFKEGDPKKEVILKALEISKRYEPNTFYGNIAFIKRNRKH